MKLLRLQVRDFLGIKHVDLDLSVAPIHVFLGQNNSGKSSVLDAVEFSITGLCRGMLRKKDADALLLRHGGSGMFVNLSWEGGQLRRGSNGCSLAERDIEAIFGPDSRVRACLSGFRFLSMAPRDRRDLVAGVTGKKGDIGQAVAKICNDAGLATSAAEAIINLAEEDIDHAEKFAVERRKELKRDLEAYKGEPAPGKLAIDGKEFDLTATSTAQISARLSERRTQRDEALRAEGHAALLDKPEIIEAKMAEIDKQIEALPKSDAQALAKAMADVRALEDVKAVALKAQAHAEGVLQSARGAAKSIDELGKKGKCPTCRQPLDAERIAKLYEEAVAAGDQAAEEIKAAADNYNKAEKDRQAAIIKSQALVESEQARATLSGKRAQLHGEIKESRDHATFAAEAKKLEAAIALGEKLLEAALLYEAGKVGAANKVGKEAAVASWDVVAKALGPEGEIRKATSKGFDLAIVQDAADKLIGQGQRVDVDGDWNITCGGTWSNGLSRSERLRLGAGFATAFAVSSGVRLVVIDEADILEPDNRKKLSGWLLTQGVDTTLLGSTRNKPPAGQVIDTSSDPRVKMWWCDKGEVAGL